MTPKETDERAAICADYKVPALGMWAPCVTRGACCVTFASSRFTPPIVGDRVFHLSNKSRLTTARDVEDKRCARNAGCLRAFA